MKPNLRKSIKAYIGVAGSVIASDKACAQIFYYDFNPDTLLSAPFNASAYLDLDVNNDSIQDLSFRARSISFASTTSSNLSANGGNLRVYGQGQTYMAKSTMQCIYSNFPINFNVVRKFNAGQAVNNASFSNQADILYMKTHWQQPTTDFTTCGLWTPGTIGCAGFRITKNGLNYYGWVKMQIITRSSMKILEYAYNQQPNGPINACSTTLPTGISENGINCDFIQKNQIVEISISHTSKVNSISVHDLLGKVILQQSFEGNKKEIEISKKGIYFIVVNSGNSIFRKKVFIY